METAFLKGRDAEIEIKNRFIKDKEGGGIQMYDEYRRIQFERNMQFYLHK